VAREIRLIGRREELKSLVEFGSVLRTGASAIVIDAPEGMGKTALWEESVRVSAEHGLHVLAARPSRSELNMAFAALSDLLDGPAGHLLSVLPDPQRHALEGVLLRREPGDDDVGMRAGSLAALHLLRHLAGTAPVLLAIDNLQWVDSASARVLGFVLRRLSSAPIGLLGTLRTGRREPVVHDALQPHQVLVVPLGPLTVGQLGELILQRQGTALPLPVLARVHRAAGGNPRWALELATDVARRRGRRLPAHLVPVPDALAACLAPRLSGLLPPARSALLVVSALAEPTPSVVRAAMSRAGMSPDGIDQAIRAGTLQLAGEEIACREPVLGTAAYARASPAQRMLVHAAIAGSVSDPDERTWHESLSRPGADRRLASRLERASRRAQDRGRFDVAAALAELAAEHTPEGDGGDLDRRCLQAAGGWWSAGDLPRARDLLRPLLDSPEHRPARTEALYFLGRLAASDQTLQSGRDLLMRALREPPREPPIAARVELELAWIAQAAGQLSEARRRGRRALALAAPPEARVEFEATALLASVAEMSGSDRPLPPEASPEPDAWASVRPELAAAQTLLRRGEVDAARAILTDLARRCRACGWQAAMPVLHLGIAELECWAGSLVGAMRHVQAGLRAARAAGQRAHQASLLATGALTSLRLGNPSSARAWAAKSVALAIRTGDVIAELTGCEAAARVELATGDDTAAADHFDAVLARWRRMGVRDPWFARFLPEHVDALIAVDRLNDAASLLAGWQRTGRRLARPWVGPLAARPAAALQVAYGDLDGALDRLSEVVGVTEPLPPYDRGRTLLLLGTVERRLKRRAAARGSLGRALDAFRSIGAYQWTEEVRRELGRSGEPSPSAALTATEARIAELAAQGLSNVEVAQRLFLSARTVEFNLTSVYRKLAVTRRGHLARRLAADATGGGWPLRMARSVESTV